jgi:hypothetical protein
MAFLLRSTHKTTKFWMGIIILISKQKFRVDKRKGKVMLEDFWRAKELSILVRFLESEWTVNSRKIFGERRKCQFSEDFWRAKELPILGRFLESEGTVNYKFIADGTVVNKEMYVDILSRLMDAVRKKRPQKWRTKIWFLRHYNVPTHGSVSIKDFLVKNKVTTQEHPPCSPDLATADVYLFARVKSALKGRRICDATDVIQKTTEELKRLSQNGFQEFFRNLYSRW